MARKRNIFKKLLGLFCICIVIAILVIFYLSKDLPNPNELGNKVVSQSVKIYDRTGTTLLYNAGEVENRHIVPLNTIPQVVRWATLAAEDDDFYKHGPIDIKSIARAIYTNILHMGKTQGASTITQQLARNAFLTRTKTYARKIKEIILAFYLENQYSKDQILEFYLNQVPYGYNAYGVESASQLYFNKPIQDVDIAEAAYLASLLKSPSYLSPFGPNKNKLDDRKNWVIDRMSNLGYITKQEADKAKKEKVVFVAKNIRMIAPHFVNFIEQELVAKYGEEAIQSGGLTVISTLDLDLQAKAEEVVKKYADLNERDYKVKNMALLSEDPKTGQILAMVGSRDFFNLENEGNFNAVFGLRQPGSSFKPFAYLTLFKKGYTDNTILFDLPTNFSTDPQNPYTPKNYDKKFRGPINLRNSLAQSLNIPSVKVLYLAGITDTINTAKSFGITTLTQDANYYGLPLVLGGGAVNLYEMVGGYAAFSQEGIYHKQSYILKVIDRDNKILEEYKDKSNPVCDAEPVRLLNDILADNLARAPLYSGGINNPLFFGDNIPVAAKTGTSQDSRDAWIFGYTPNIVTGVWVGNNDYSPIYQGSVTGGLVAAPAWHEFMQYAITKNSNIEYFTKPQITAISKPMLNGQYINSIGGSLQIHSILFYIDKNNPLGPIPRNPANDSQFYNWEGPVIAWAQNNIQDFNTVYNKPMSLDVYDVDYGSNVSTSPTNTTSYSKELQMKFLNVQNGQIWNNDTQLQVQVTGGTDLIKQSVYLNNQYIGEMNLISQNQDTKIYGIMIYYNTLQPQNEIRVHLQDSALDIIEDAITIYK